MPIIQIELFPGRSQTQKDALACAITDACVEVLGNVPEDVTVTFNEVQKSDWYNAAKSMAELTSSSKGTNDVTTDQNE